MKAIEDPGLKQEIMDAYFAYFTAYTGRNWPRMIACFDEGITMIGTGIDEIALSGEATRSLFEREFAQAPANMTFTIKTCNLFSICTDIALLIIVMDMNFLIGQETICSRNNRTSAVMVRQGESWKIAHAHWSQPDANQEEGESLPFKLLLDENRRLEALIAKSTEALRQSNAELSDALAKVKTLKGILPICAHCKKIRDDAGYWTQVEQYISQYTDAFFSHSICPSCLEKHYPDMADDLESEENGRGRS
jgi:hypothetical protein